ncbi:MAG: TIGR02391 family protein [Methanoregula sp.]|nr:TIGR02391 family protein [Methanoregula sp.]
MPGRLYDLFPDPDALLSLEPEELAGVVLEFLNSLGPEYSGQYLNSHNFSLPHTVDGYPQQKKDEILKALMEAWVWLEREGMLAPQPGSFNEGWVFITRRGKQVSNREGLEQYHHSNLLPRQLLHPVIAQRVWSDFLRGEYDSAVFKAFKEVEVEVREVCEYSPTDLGVDLIRKAFNATNGPLTDMSKPIPEREALSHLFAGAIGSYKNPHSHRNVDIGPEEAVEMIMLASHLLKIVDTRHGAIIARTLLQTSPE